jgi:hypothetical protein
MDRCCSFAALCDFPCRRLHAYGKSFGLIVDVPQSGLASMQTALVDLYRILRDRFPAFNIKVGVYIRTTRQTDKFSDLRLSHTEPWRTSSTLSSVFLARKLPQVACLITGFFHLDMYVMPIPHERQFFSGSDIPQNTQYTPNLSASSCPHDL